MHKKIIAVALFATASVAYAGGYFGAGLGQSSADVGQYYGPSVSVSDTDTAFKIFGGYEFNENIAIEGGYTYLGEFGGSYTYTDGFYLYTDSEMVEAGAFYVAAVATIPLGPVSTSARRASRTGSPTTRITTTGTATHGPMPRPESIRSSARV